MRSDRRKQEEALKKQSAGGFAGFTRIWAILFLILSVAFGVILFLADILVPKYLLIAGLVILLLFVIVFPPLFRKKSGTGSRVLAFIMSILLFVIYGVGGRYLLGTMDFMSKITNIASTEEYYVVVRDDDGFAELADIAGEMVYGYRTGSEFGAAASELQNAVSVTVEESTDLVALRDQLLDATINVTFLNSGVYDTMAEEDEDYGDFTKVLDTIKVTKEVVDIRKPVEVSNNSFNIYVTGIDTVGTIDVVSRSDVNMILTVNPDAKTILMTSIPRDYYVVLPDVGAYDKLTHTGIYGADYTVAAVENLLGIDINYYVKVNFSTVELLVDAIGGVEVESDYSFTSRIGGYYFEAGTNYMDGAQALAFARERYAFSDGDFQRNINQQRVMRAIISKVTSSSTLLTSYASILNSLENNFETNMTPDEIKSLVKMQSEDMSSWNISSQSIVGATSSETCYALGNGYASVVLQDPDSIASAVENINAVMNG